MLLASVSRYMKGDNKLDIFFFDRPAYINGLKIYIYLLIQGERGQPGKDAEVPSLDYLDNLAEKTVHEVMDKV